MPKQDRVGIRSPDDVEMRIAGLQRAMESNQKAVKQTEQGLVDMNATLEGFAMETLKVLEDMQDQIDGKIDTWFYSGVPTLENEPANQWTTDELIDHLGDLYYDQDTGNGYRFVLNNGEYGWMELPDTEAAQALAIANAAKDTADNKRRVFLDTPAPPYDCGDLWIHEGELWRCQISKLVDEAYEEKDFIVATHYTDDTVANQTKEELQVLRGTVTTIKENADSFQIEIEQKVRTLDSTQQLMAESVQKTSYNFGTEDLHIRKTGEPLTTRISHNGMRVQHNNEDRLVADEKGVDATNLHARTYLIVGNNSRFEDYEGGARTGCFWIGE